MDGDDMQRLWSLIEDLTNQLQANRQLCESLQQQADQLRGQAIHSGTGFALRRFNTDLSKEKFESELEALNAHLVKENLGLSHENKQQALLLREYENTLETVMAKFRSFSHSTQHHTLQLTQHYESLLAQTSHNAAEQTLAAETAFSGTLTHLGGLVRRAMQSLDGQVSDNVEEEEYDDHSPSKAKRGWSQHPKWYGSGGYTGKATDPVAMRADDALEQLTEEERLRMENETLRELLGLKHKGDALLSTTAGADGASQTGVHASSVSNPVSTVERRASLTVDEATIAAEASGQPPHRTLQVSSITRPGEEEASTSSQARASPKLMPALERKDQIIEEAILADESETDRGRRAGEASPSIGSDRQEPPPSVTASLPVVFAADDADTAPSSIEELRAASKQEQALSQVHATLPAQSEATGAASTDADEITPIDEVDVVTSVEPATSEAPNMLAEAAPPALVSTGIEESDSKTTVTSASGIDVAEVSTTPSTADDDPAESLASSSDILESSNDTSVSSTSASDGGLEADDTVASVDKGAPPAESIRGDFQPIPAESATIPSIDSSKLEERGAIIPAEPAKQDNVGVGLEAHAPKDTAAGEENAEIDARAVVEDKASDSVVALATLNLDHQAQKDGSASPRKKGKNRGKGNRHHHKLSSSASNKSLS
ncbi:uncharacterized protein MEPE_05337 [Melanopsichium pennsylvanicum]|uniref:Uncharacterized protein n=2 Tax=Melanopsichium pennsylvanicum TaxID=63383 RepID=A0AAJ4XQU4_9BASI|nr:uncharacterized protein MEPE_05337 [Melanopsichium pennsylvanicum]